MKSAKQPRLKDPIRPMGRARGGLETRWARDGEGNGEFDGFNTQNYEDPTLGTDRPSERGGIRYTRRVVERTRDMIIIKLESRNVPFSAIARILGMHKAEAHRRFTNIPEKVRKHYARIGLG